MNSLSSCLGASSFWMNNLCSCLGAMWQYKLIPRRDAFHWLLWVQSWPFWYSKNRWLSPIPSKFTILLLLRASVIGVKEPNLMNFSLILYWETKALMSSLIMPLLFQTWFFLLHGVVWFFLSTLWSSQEDG